MTEPRLIRLMSRDEKLVRGITGRPKKHQISAPAGSKEYQREWKRLRQEAAGK